MSASQTNPNGGMERTIRGAFRPRDQRGQAALASLALFIVAPMLGVFVTGWFFFLLIPAVLLSILGLAGVEKGSGTAGRLGSTGLIMTFNGIALMISLFLVGFITDFILTNEDDHLTSSVAFGYTTVHIMLGVGLMLYDNYRHRAG